MNKALTLLFILSLSIPLLSDAQVIINEVQYANKTTLIIDNGKSPDWIELYNPSEENMVLHNYKIGDSKAISEAWAIPFTTIPAKGYLLIYASGEDIRKNDNLHTNFKLSVLEDSLFLFNASEQIVDSVIPECVPVDKSLSYINNYKARQVVNPSPGSRNLDPVPIALNYKPDTLIVNYPSGRYKDELNLVFTNTVVGNQILFTLDSKDPNIESDIYSEPINLQDISSNENRFAQKVEYYKPGNLISKASIVRAQVFSDGCPASKEISNTYFVGSDQSFQYKVPVISIITDKDNLFDDDEGIYVIGNHNNCFNRGSMWERPAQIEYFDTTGLQVIDQMAGIRIHGRTSRGVAQKSLRLYAKEKYGSPTFNYAFFNQKPTIDQFNTLTLRTTFGDWSETVFKDELCHEIVESMNMDYLASQTNIVYLNGEYWGIYSLRERQDEGYISNNYQIENPQVDIISIDGAMEDGVDAKSGDMENYEELLNWFRTNDPNGENFYQEAAKKIDLDNLSDYYIAQIYLAQLDFPFLNIDMWRSIDDTSKWRYFFFDLDGTMMDINYNHLKNYNNTISDLQRFEYEEQLIFSQLLANKTFRDKFYSKYLNHIKTTFNTERLLELIEAYAAEYSPLIPDHIYRWGRPIDIHQWTKNVQDLQRFAIHRPAIAMDQLIENFENPFSIYPNPAKSSFTISLYENTFSDATYSIHDSQGNPIINEKVLTQNTTIDKDLSPGMYVVIIEINGYYFHEKVSVL